MNPWSTNYKGLAGPYPVRVGPYVNFKYTIISKDDYSIFTLSFVKNYLKVTQDNDDELISFIMNSACKFAENYMKKDISLTRYSTSRDVWGLDFFLKRSPFVSIQNIFYLKNNVFTLVDPSIYYTYNQDPYASILLAKNKNWPIDLDNVLSGIKIEFTAGFLSVPFDIINAILAHISYLYQQRGDCDCSNMSGNSVPLQSKQVYDSYRIQEGIIYRQIT